MARTYPSDGMSPIDGYASVAPDRALGHFQWDASGATVPAGDAVVFIDVNDSQTRAGGTIRGLKVDYSSTGTKTGANWNIPIEINVDVSANACFVQGLVISTSSSGNPTLETIIPIYIYADDPGTACGALYGQRIQVYGGKATAADGIFSLRNIGASPLDFVIQLESAGMATYFVKQDGTGAPFGGGSHTSVHGYYKCHIAGNDCYIALYT